MQLVWSEPAAKDLEEIITFIAREDIQSALIMDILLQEAAEGLLLFPHKGKPGRVLETRELVPHEHYILVYTVNTTTISIVNVIHTSRQWPPA